MLYLLDSPLAHSINDLSTKKRARELVPFVGEFLPPQVVQLFLHLHSI